MLSNYYENLIDKELIELLRDGDIKAFEEIYNRYWLSLFNKAFQIIKDQSVAKDITQDIFVSLWTNRKKADILNLSAYLYRSIRLKVFQTLRNNNISKKHLEKIGAIAFVHNTEEQLKLNEIQSQLDLHLSNLPNKCQEIFRLSRIEHLSNREIAKKLDISLKTVEGHITYALKYLRHNLTDFITIFIFYILS